MGHLRRPPTWPEEGRVYHLVTENAVSLHHELRARQRKYPNSGKSFIRDFVIIQRRNADVPDKCHLLS